MDPEEKKIYEDRFNEHGLTAKGCGYKKSKEHALIRYYSCMNTVKFSPNDTLLDVGCGTGIGYEALNTFLNYNGIDRLDHYVNALKEKHPQSATRFSCNDINDIEEQYDWVLFSGVFSLDVKNDQRMYDEYVKSTLKRTLSSIARKGIIFNGIGDQVDYKDKDTHYFNVPEWLKILQSWGRVSGVVYPAGLTPFEFYLSVST